MPGSNLCADTDGPAFFFLSILVFVYMDKCSKFKNGEEVDLLLNELDKLQFVLIALINRTKSNKESYLNFLKYDTGTKRYVGGK